MKLSQIPTLVLIAGLALAPARAEGLLGTGSAPAAWAPLTRDELQVEVERLEELEGRGEATPEMTNQVVAHLVGLAFSKLARPALLALQTLNRNRPTQGLTAEARDRLQPIFGDLVDEVKVVYEARMYDARTLRTLLGDGWVVAQLKKFGVFERITLVEEAAAMANGDWVFVAGRAGAEGQVRLMAHELTHVRQHRRAGSLEDAAYNYGYALVMCGWDYASHPLENEARGVAASLDT